MPHNKEIEEKINEYLDFCKSKGIKTGYHQVLETTIVSDWWIETLTSYGKSQYDKGVEETRKSIREEIGGKKVKVNGVVIEQDMKNLGYNQALDEILSLKSLE